ncbi:SpoVR family protein [Planctomycetes bacterium Pla163]|uniref:SpoVR family protein n=1 Tax=Rohdeia mirabilis TaxID=2528008 RepID=A0A518D1H8_9BACT|nr:SpoVR family protein [Planctomycetes bacterium Pla163]
MGIKTTLPPELKYHALVIEEKAREYGLEFFDVVFELLDARDVNGIAAYGGFPVRYPSWRFGMEFEKLQRGYSWGMSKIYELVINNDPTYAYLVRSNSLLEQKLVMAHVYGHADFFRNNVWFAGTERRMLDRMAHDATRVRRMIDAHGQETVEKRLDDMLSLEALVDPYLSRVAQPDLAPRRSLSEHRGLRLENFGRDASSTPAPVRAVFPEADVLGYLVREAPLEDWERELLEIVRAEAYYFLPQRLTKVANEGWACYWHSKILTGGLLDASEIIDFADVHSGATAAAPGQFNPYRLGLRLFRYAEALGHDLFMLRRIHNDVSLIDALVDERFALEYHGASESDALAARGQGFDWKAWKEGLLASLTFGGQPRITLVGRDVEGHGELVLEHHHDGRDLQLGQAGETMKRLASVWGAPVHLATRVDDEPCTVVATADTVDVRNGTEGPAEQAQAS